MKLPSIHNNFGLALYLKKEIKNIPMRIPLHTQFAELYVWHTRSILKCVKYFFLETPFSFFKHQVQKNETHCKRITAQCKYRYVCMHE